MSAWLCSQEHINLLVAAADDVADREQAFKMLVQENLRSLKERYPGRDFLQDWINDAANFKYEAVEPLSMVSRVYKRMSADERNRRQTPSIITNQVVATQIVMACDCYDYQACETDDYKSTDAAKFIDRVRAVWLGRGGLGEGKLYDQCLWGF